MKIAILVVYFGRLPKFTQLFLASCARNRGVDFFLIGDAWKGVLGDVPSNCYLDTMDLDQLVSLVNRKTGFMPNIASPYKLCDFKPAFGDIFQEKLAGYDYWGFSDIDLILGDLMEFLTHLDKYDIFSTRQEFLSGPFFLMRNTASINRLYKNSKDIARVLTSDQHFCFDECNFAWVELKGGRSILEIETEIESMTEVIAKFGGDRLLVHYKTLSLEPSKAFRGRVEVNDGKIIMGNRAYIHYHHHLNKGRSLYTYPSWTWREVPETYYISRYGIFSEGWPQDLLYRSSQCVNCWGKRIRKWFSGNQHDVNASKVT